VKLPEEFFDAAAASIRASEELVQRVVEQLAASPEDPIVESILHMLGGMTQLHANQVAEVVAVLGLSNREKAS
jgi:hypothetical protein